MRICHQRQVRGGGRVRWAGNKRRGAASAESSATSASRRALQRHRGRDASRDELHQAGRSWRESGTCGYVAEDAQLIGPIRTGVNRRSRGGLTLGSPPWRRGSRRALIREGDSRVFEQTLVLGEAAMAVSGLGDRLFVQVAKKFKSSIGERLAVVKVQRGLVEGGLGMRRTEDGQGGFS